MDKKNYRFSMVATDSGKTRISCSRCRKKNMVCDKLMPSCTNCLKRGLNCAYPLRKQWTRRESKEFERKDRESKKRQKRIESDHGTKKKKMTEEPRPGSSEFEDVSAWLSQAQRDPLFDPAPPFRSASDNAISDSAYLPSPPSSASSSTSSSSQSSPLDFTNTTFVGGMSPHTNTCSPSPGPGPGLVNTHNNNQAVNTTLLNTINTTPTTTTITPNNTLGMPGEFNRTRASSDLSRIGAMPVQAISGVRPANAEVSAARVSGNALGQRPSGEFGRARASSDLSRNKANRGGARGVSPTSKLGRGGGGISPSFNLGQTAAGIVSDRGYSQRPPSSRPLFPPRISGELGGDNSGHVNFISQPPQRIRVDNIANLSSSGEGVSPVPMNSPLPPLKEVLEADPSKEESSDFFADSNFTTKSLSNPFSCTAAYGTPSSPSFCSPSSSFSVRNDSHQLPLSPLSSLSISSQPPHPFFLSSMMNSTFPPPSTATVLRGGARTLHHSSAGQKTTPPMATAPSLLSHLPPLLSSSSLSPPPLQSSKGPKTPARTLSQTMGANSFFSSSTPFPLDSTSRCSSDGTLLETKEGPTTSQASPNALCPQSKPSWSGSAPVSWSGTAPPTSPTPNEEEVITAQEHAFFEEMGWLTLGKDKAPEASQITPTTAVVRASLSDENYQAKLVEKSTSPMVSMFFGAYRTANGDIRIEVPRFVARNRLAQKEFCLNAAQSLKGQYHPVSQRRVFEEMRSRFVAPPDQVVQEVRFGILVDDKKGNWIEYATCANYFYGAEGLLTYVTRTFVKCSPSPNGPSIEYLMGKEREGKDQETAREDGAK